MSWKGDVDKVAYDAPALWTGIGAAGEVTFLCDSSIFHDNAPREQWNSLLNGDGEYYITPRVENELAAWLARRPRHPVARARRDGKPGLRVLAAADWSAPEQHAFIHYTNMLRSRKLMMGWGKQEFERIHGRAPQDTDRTTVRGYVQRAVGERGFLFAKKGQLQQVAGRYSNADEETVYTAVAHALRTGRQTVILTGDEDLLDQFYRLVYLIDTHYRSMLIAEMYRREFGSFRTHPMPTSERYLDAFTGSANILVERDLDLPHRVLSASFTFVGISCWLVGASYLHLTFGAEREMH